MPRKPRQVRFTPFIAQCPDCGDLCLMTRPGAFAICGGCNPKSATAFDAGDGHYWRQIGKAGLAKVFKLRSKETAKDGFFIFRPGSKYGNRRPRPLPL